MSTITICDIDSRKVPMFMRTHRTKCRCLKRFGVCILAIGLLPILIVYFMVSDQIYYRIKRTDVSIHAILNYLFVFFFLSKEFKENQYFYAD